MERVLLVAAMQIVRLYDGWLYDQYGSLACLPACPRYSNDWMKSGARRFFCMVTKQGRKTDDWGSDEVKKGTRREWNWRPSVSMPVAEPLLLVIL